MSPTAKNYKRVAQPAQTAGLQSCECCVAHTTLFKRSVHIVMLGVALQTNQLNTGFLISNVYVPIVLTKAQI
jgi:hypothetical protein